jgi:acyl-CoA reductase-like NAD-dependent aldehyde dehydrogenase
MAELLEDRVEDYARLIVLEMGKPIGEARAEIKKAASGCRQFVRRGQRTIPRASGDRGFAQCAHRL